VARFQLGNGVAFVSDVLHVFPPLLGVQLPHQMFPHLLIENQPSIGRLLMDVVDGAVCLFVVAVDGQAVWAFDVVVDEGELEAVLDFGVEVSEALHEAVGVPVVYLAREVLACR